MDTFYFGRLNYNSDGELNLKELLTSGKRFHPKKGHFKYGIFSFLELEDPELGTVYTGELVKYQELKEEPVVKEDKISSEYIEDVILGKSQFYLLAKSHLIAYNPYGKIISPQSFCETFVALLMASDDSFNIDAEIYPVNYEYEFMSFIKTMRTLNSIEIVLTPSNPNSRDLWENIDERLRGMNAKRYNEKIEARDNESLKIDEVTENKIVMAQDGYGKAKGKGTDENGYEVEVSTESKKSITKKSVKKDLLISEQLNAIRDVFLRVIERFKNT